MPTRSGHRTCNNPSHQQYEEYRNQKNKGFFLLRERLKRAGVHQPSTSVELGNISFDDLADLDDTDARSLEDPAHKSDKGNRPSKAMFSRRRTHNEQLVVCSCGIIAARATMYGAEAISGVKVSLCPNLKPNGT